MLSGRRIPGDRIGQRELAGVGILGQLATQYAGLSGAFPLIAVVLEEWGG
jgi:hypothetical protein